jgi:putative copper export protein
VDVAIRAVHLIAAAIWAGGLVFLAVAAGVARSTIPERERVEFFRRLGRRFLVVSLVAAALLAATGADMAADRLASWDGLFETEWGRIIRVKTVLFATAVLLALVHALVLGPRIRELRLQLLENPGDAELEARMKSLRIASTVTQVVILAETVAILILAADLIA